MYCLQIWYGTEASFEALTTCTVSIALQRASRDVPVFCASNETTGILSRASQLDGGNAVRHIPYSKAYNGWLVSVTAKERAISEHLNCN